MNPPEMWHTPFSWLFTTSQVRACWVSVNLTSFYFFFFHDWEAQGHDTPAPVSHEIPLSRWFITQATSSVCSGNLLALRFITQATSSVSSGNLLSLRFITSYELSSSGNLLALRFRTVFISLPARGVRILSSLLYHFDLSITTHLRSLDHYLRPISRSRLLSHRSLDSLALIAIKSSTSQVQIPHDNHIDLDDYQQILLQQPSSRGCRECYLLYLFIYYNIVIDQQMNVCLAWSFF